MYILSTGFLKELGGGGGNGKEKELVKSGRERCGYIVEKKQWVCFEICTRVDTSDLSFCVRQKNKFSINGQYLPGCEFGGDRLYALLHWSYL